MTKNGYGLFLSVLVIGIGVFLGSFLCEGGSLEAKMLCGFGLIFMTIGGIPFILELKKAIKKKKYRVGDKVKVYAEPDDYSKYMMDVYNQL